MNGHTAIVFGLIGIGMGISIPKMSSRMIDYKSSKGSVNTTGFCLNRNGRIFIAALNGFLWTYAGFGTENVLTALLISVLFTAAILISVIDLETRIIPNEMILFLIFLGIIFQVLHFSWSALFSALLCMAAIGIIFALAGRIVGLEQVGAGDVKLAAAIGMVLGFPQIKIALAGMSAALLVFCIGGLAARKLTTRSTFPFAPFIMFGTICALINIGKL